MEITIMKNVFTSLLIGTAFVAGAAHATDFSETQYPFVKNAVSPVQQNLIVDQNDTNDSAYPAIRIQSSASRADVRQELATYQAQNPADLYSGD